MPTVAGLIFIAVAVFFIARRPRSFFGLLVFSAIFPATSALNFGSLWIMPYYVLAPVFVAMEFRRHGWGMFSYPFEGRWSVILFGCFGAVTAILYPLIFAGTQVYSPRLGSSDETFYTFPLSFSVSSIAQPAYLVMNVLVLFAAVSAAQEEGFTQIVSKALDIIFYCVMGVNTVEMFCLVSGVPFPYPLIENNPIRTIFYSGRLHGTCGEPSFNGLVLVGFFAAYFYCYYIGKASPWRAIFAGIAIFLTTSSSGIIALAVSASLIVLLHPPVKFPLAIHTRRIMRIVPVLVCTAIALQLPYARTILEDYLLNKGETGSYYVRTTENLYSLNLLSDTYGIGVGIGSYRPASLIASLLGCVGIVGTAIFAYMIYRICRYCEPDRRWIRWAFLAALFDMAIAIADITHPIFWCYMALLLVLGKKHCQAAGHVQDFAQVQSLPI